MTIKNIRKTSRFISLLLVSCLILANSSLAVSTKPTSDSSLGGSRCLTIADSSVIGLKSNQISTNSFNTTAIASLASYDLINIENADLVKNLDKNAVHQLLDNGSIFFVSVPSIEEGIRAFENMSESVYGGTRTLSGATVNGIYIYNDNGMYRFSLHAVRELIPENTDVASVASVASAASNASKSCAKNVTNYDAIIKHVRSLSKASRTAYLDKHSDGMVELQLPTKLFNREVGDTVSLYKNVLGFHEIMGSITITQYVYNICTTGIGNAIKTDYYDVVTTFIIDADDHYSVDTYTGTISAKYNNLKIINAEFLDSQTTTTISLSGGIESDSEHVITGSLGGSTTYTYSATQQNLNNDLAIDDGECNWTATPVVQNFGGSWKLEPAVRIKNIAAETNQSGAFSSLSHAKMRFYDVSGPALIYTISDLPIEVGEFWVSGSSET